MRYNRTGDAPPEPTFSWRVKVIAALVAAALLFVAITAFFLIRDASRIDNQPRVQEKKTDLWVADDVL